MVENQYAIEGYEQIEREVKEIGNGAHVLVPRDWLGGEVSVILTKSPENGPVLSESWSADRVLTSDQKESLQAAFRTVLSNLNDQQGAPERAVETTPPLVEEITVDSYSGRGLHVSVYIDHDDHDMSLTVDEAEDCMKHPGEKNTGGLDTLAVLGEEYANLEKDLLEVTALMCDLPEIEAEWGSYGVNVLGFEALTCYDGALKFMFSVVVPEVILHLYRDYDYELAHHLGIPVDKNWSGE